MSKNKLDKPKDNNYVKNKDLPRIWQDERFHHLVADPRFKSFPKSQRKVKIDNRFQRMFTDDVFKIQYTVDKHGRKLNKSSSENLRKFYEISSSDSECEENEKQKEEQTISSYTGIPEEKSNKSFGREDIYKQVEILEKTVAGTLKERLLNPNIDYARGEGYLETDSSSGESTDDESDPVLNMDHVWGELDAEAELTDKSTSRLAICHMDWDRIRAVDLMAVVSSFLPTGGTVLSIKIYPSEYGKTRMTEEEVFGPTELVNYREKKQYRKNAYKSESIKSEQESLQSHDSDYEAYDDAYHMEKLRQYQLNRLRYYYAVAEFDSIQTADKVYKECDGLEYESSATRIDLRFIPDNISFDDNEPSDVCTSLPDNTYIPRNFTTSALHEAKVNLTWDETAVERREISEKLASSNLEDIQDKDIKKIVAISSSENDDDDSIIESNIKINSNNTSRNEFIQSNPIRHKTNETKKDIINKYRTLLAEIDESEKKQKTKKFDMEFSWVVEDSKNGNDINEENSGDNVSDKTTIEKVLQKRSEKNKKRKEERKKRKLQAHGNDIENKNSNEDSDSIPDGIDMNDSYFAEEFANGDFIDTVSEKKLEKLKIEIQSKEDHQFHQKQKAKELELLIDEDENERHSQHFNYEKIFKFDQGVNSKRKRRKFLKKSKSVITENKKLEDTFQINVNDERFKAMYSEHLYNIDPTDSHFRKTKGMERIMDEKLKRRYCNKNLNKFEMSVRTKIESKPQEKQLENNILVKNLKFKIQKRETV
ncbi:ESF1 homolog [Teleopsis dalmanni]|uniref:ESF1 homolog n=1 Tax=Teleopsis dalmanni TaxID=139649 RepID=UPI0018CD3496|nr:ESF1 homolog [Teleopsis dalmanni]